MDVKLCVQNFEDSSKDEGGKHAYKSIQTINFFPSNSYLSFEIYFKEIKLFSLAWMSLQDFQRHIKVLRSSTESNEKHPTIMVDEKSREEYRIQPTDNGRPCTYCPLVVFCLKLHKCATNLPPTFGFELWVGVIEEDQVLLKASCGRGSLNSQRTLVS
ncbi:hypothetical protein M9H77_23201 [Catharanthus roseus]|uniref:Uncharacterized protein n=1 Tax=Catharanthus roseus TaxID=4058 RepID=A0ACC0AWQ2_CATRO|nr:hypothetical protein M9H77_23201 [Catharanthus roseus]